MTSSCSDSRAPSCLPSSNFSTPAGSSRRYSSATKPGLVRFISFRVKTELDPGPTQRSHVQRGLLNWSGVHLPCEPIPVCLLFHFPASDRGYFRCHRLLPDALDSKALFVQQGEKTDPWQRFGAYRHDARHLLRPAHLQFGQFGLVEFFPPRHSEDCDLSEHRRIAYFYRDLGFPFELDFLLLLPESTGTGAKVQLKQNVHANRVRQKEP